MALTAARSSCASWQVRSNKSRGQTLLFHALIGEAGADDARLFGIEQHDFGRPRPCVYAGVNHAVGLEQEPGVEGLGSQIPLARTVSTSASTRAVMRAESDGE